MRQWNFISWNLEKVQIHFEKKHNHVYYDNKEKHKTYKIWHKTYLYLPTLVYTKDMYKIQPGKQNNYAKCFSRLHRNNVVHISESSTNMYKPTYAAHITYLLAHRSTTYLSLHNIQLTKFGSLWNFIQTRCIGSHNLVLLHKVNVIFNDCHSMNNCSIMFPILRFRCCIYFSRRVSHYTTIYGLKSWHCKTKIILILQI